MIILNKKTKIVIGIICIIIAVIGIATIYFQNSITKPKKIKFSGIVIDRETQKPIEGLIIRVDNQKTNTDKYGKFTLQSIYDNQILIINSKNQYQDVQIPINHNTNLKIWLSNRQLALIEDIVNYEKHRQYSQIYQLFSVNLKKQFSKDEYLNLKNNWFDRITQKNQYILDIKIDPSTNNINYIISNNNKLIKIITDKNILDYNNDQWTITKALMPND